jgi:uncharacterized protein (DUF1697 family)
MSPRKITALPVAAFLRGLNVGGHRLTMDTLRDAFRALGLGDARTFIASGNVVFDAKGGNLRKLEATIEEGLFARLGYRVDTFLRTADDVRSLAGSEPFSQLPRLPDDRVHVIFLKTPPPQGLDARLLGVVPAGDAVTILGREVLWLRRGKLSDVKLRGSDPVQAVISTPSTMRNLNTVQRLSASFFETT